MEVDTETAPAYEPDHVEKCLNTRRRAPGMKNPGGRGTGREKHWEFPAGAYRR
ncbi:MAG: hypothetical protein LBG10_06880 [Treponema sp.]|nr:hypothetical protein [Treponema sp.]